MLVPSTLSEQKTSEAMGMKIRPTTFVELCRPHAYPVAMLIKQMLEQNGVNVIVQGANAISVQPHLAFGGELRVMVDGQQLEFARQLYQAYFESDTEVDYENSP
jgi:ABC-type transport system substrate-binding protein